MIARLMVAVALAVIAIEPPVTTLLAFAGHCDGTLRVYAPAHPDNRRVLIQQNDGTNVVDVSEADIPAAGFSRVLHLSMGAGEHRTITAWVLGVKTVRGSAVARVTCV